MTRIRRVLTAATLAVALSFGSAACTPAMYEMWLRMMPPKTSPAQPVDPAEARSCPTTSPLNVFVSDPGNTAAEWAWAVDVMTRVHHNHPGLFAICGGTVSVRFVDDPGNWNAAATSSWVKINSRRFGSTSPVGYEQALVHEITHVWDYRNMTDLGRSRLMSMLQGCRSAYDGVCTEPFQATWWTGNNYGEHSCEVFAEVYSRHVWYADDSMRMWGSYTWGDDFLPRVVGLIEQ